ncbi:Slp1p NDAI_0F02310 [Naumovozyma dairenensis CBS 421]|uniref:SUN-like protein 1 n=1 Tax=Naumovozyma dairenensis (strain ATCC 10597 / BCRC 20456 / CBS 421 / NBRC 0211 / NRRL Y-12639) TaxID=1071378 RepID=G0WCN8_NAUDC|nr:hypothetical protein NDAI_0F02310 [Naumovozyma dairenensis CBS 421]CCD25549.1 hypothetical protein NDAI_0F02310 [Naumovozyma dairenensis CBS 421]
MLGSSMKTVLIVLSGLVITNCDSHFPSIDKVSTIEPTTISLSSSSESTLGPARHSGVVIHEQTMSYPDSSTSKASSQRRPDITSMEPKDDGAQPGEARPSSGSIQDTYTDNNEPNISIEKERDIFLSFDAYKEAKLHEHDHHSSWKRHQQQQYSSSSKKNIINTSEDSLGDEMEIELGFFLNGNDDDDNDDCETDDEEVDLLDIDEACLNLLNSIDSNIEGEEQDDDDGSTGQKSNSLYKRRYNYASLDCAATIVKTNPEAMGSTSILVENKDSYLLNPCSVKQKFIIIELCEDILVEEIDIANFEFFSSTFKQIRVSVSDRFPVKENNNKDGGGWKILGKFEAINNRELQRFKIENPQIWARYLKIEILSYYDNEFYCPISLVRVHGKTMMDEFKSEQQEQQQNNNQKDNKDALLLLSSANNSCGNIQDKEILSKLITDNLIKSNATTIKKNLTKDDILLQGKCKVKTPIAIQSFDKFLKNHTEKIQESISSNKCPSIPIPEDSFLKNIVKRLSALEDNSTLTLLYIEEQTRLLSQSLDRIKTNHSITLNDILLSNEKYIRANSMIINELQNQIYFQKILLSTMIIAILGLFSYLLLSKEVYVFNENYIEESKEMEMRRHSTHR